MISRSQVTCEEQSSGEHAHDPGAVPLPDVFLGPEALNAAQMPPQPLADRRTADAGALNSGLLLQCQRKPVCQSSRGARALATDVGNKHDPSLPRCTEL